MVAMDTAKDLASCWNNSETINQGIPPGPIEKLNMTPHVNNTSKIPGAVVYKGENEELREIFIKQFAFSCVYSNLHVMYLWNKMQTGNRMQRRPVQRISSFLPNHTALMSSFQHDQL